MDVMLPLGLDPGGMPAVIATCKAAATSLATLTTVVVVFAWAIALSL